MLFVARYISSIDCIYVPRWNAFVIVVTTGAICSTQGNDNIGKWVDTAEQAQAEVSERCFQNNP